MVAYKEINTDSIDNMMVKTLGVPKYLSNCKPPNTPSNIIAIILNAMLEYFPASAVLSDFFGFKGV